MEKSKSRSHYHWVILGCGILLHFCCAGSSNLLGSAMPFIREKVGLNYSQVSFLQTTRSTAFMLGTMISVKLYEKITLRLGCMVGFALAIIGGLLYGWGSNFPSLMIAAICMGAGNGIGGAMPAALLIRRWFDKKLGFAQGLCTVGSSITTMIFAAPFAMLIRANGVFFGYQMVEIIVAVGAILFFILARNFPEEKGLLRYGEGEEDDPVDEGKAKKKAPRKKGAGPVKQLSAVDKTWLYTAVAGISIMTMCGWNFFGVAATGLGYDPVFAAAMSSLFGVMGLIGRPLYGVISDRFGNTPANCACFAFIVVGHVLLSMMDGSAMFYVYAATVTLGLTAMTPNQVGYSLWAADLTSEENYPKFLKNMRTFSSLVGLFAMPVAGVAADYFGSYKPVFLFIAVLSVFPLIIVQFLYRRYVSTNETKTAAL